MRRFGLFGQSLEHSFSPKHFADKFERDGIEDASYDAFEHEKVDGVKEVLATPHLVGFNVTIPYKKFVVPFLDGLSKTARAVGAVNTIHGIDGVATGHNTDVHGFRASLKPVLRSHHQRALILGSGGASAAVAYTLSHLGIQAMVITRNPRKSNQATYSDLNALAIQNFPLIINTTPLGQWPEIEQMPDIPYEAISSQNLLVDLIYNPEETEFLRRGKERGALTLNGQSMLIHQAERSWEIWTGQKEEDCEPW